MASPTENVHSPILFPNSPVARIVFIPSQSNKRWSDYDGKFSIHCGAVDSLGRVHNYCGHRGLRVDEVGWADAMVINLATVLDPLKVQSRMWDTAIHECSEDLLRGHSDDPNLHADKERFDCLDFLVIQCTQALKFADKTRMSLLVVHQVDVDLFAELGN
ncbi:hypothetical protein CLF_112820 [Clonorchis sinensis]|uniref:Uncharacterized protein n=1 Tax=Clonorchis sinensis TaxID=79923 RepID=H2KVP3_CLOSI|nr:hypothetical protein CLF_112820 [Clonorchis sinensis]